MARRLGKAPEIYDIPARSSFVDALAQGIMQRFGTDPLRLSEVLILLPNRRAIRSLRDAFLRLSDGKPLLLPRMQPIGDVEEDELIFGLDDPALPPAISPALRQMLLMDIIKRWYRESRPDEKAPEVAQRAILAAALGQLLDQVQTEELDFSDMEKLVPEEYADHWQKTLNFLKILTRHWPGILKETGHMDQAERRTRLLKSLREKWLNDPPQTPVIAAGSTGSIPATSALLEVVARLPQGCVILPGLDRDMDRDSWDALGPSHPQYNMKMLLQAIGAEMVEVENWTSESPDARTRLLNEMMRPAETTPEWQNLDLDLEASLKGLRRIDAPGPREEAGIIALLLREALETEGRTAALITPDRQLARRVANEMARWGIPIDDSAGTPLFNTAPGVYLRLVARMAGEKFAPIPLLSALKHPLCKGGDGEFRKMVRFLDRKTLRGPRPAPGLDGITQAIENKDVRDWWQDFSEQLKPLENIMLAPRASFEELLHAHIETAENLAGVERLWKGDAGEEAARLVEELLQAAAALPNLKPEQYPALFDVFMSPLTVRPKYGQHPRLNIWGPLEARLQHADLMILSGLNEKSWPPEAPADPWMSRQMRAAFGLPSLDQKIGLSAHDFIQAAAAPNVVITRSAKLDGTPTVKSRWLSRLEALVSEGGRDTDWLGWFNLLDKPQNVQPANPPRPTPPVDKRPRKLSVTGIQQWMSDPYGLYARHILKLRPLDPLDSDPGASDKGTIIHEALDKFMTACPDDLPGDATDQLIAIGRAEFDHVLDRPTVRAFWWPRFKQVASWFVDNERSRRPDKSTIETEIDGEYRFSAPGGDFRLTAKADRIDRLEDGSLSIIDYKTGRVPTLRELYAGYAPQLPLEAVIFGDDLKAEVSDLSYWQLKGGKMVATIKSYDEDVAELTRLAREGLHKLVTTYDNPNTPYLNNPRPQILGYGDYDHLARTREWSGREDR